MTVAAASLAAAVSLVSACSSAGPTSVRAAAATGQLPSQLAAEAVDWYFPATAAQYAAGARYEGEIISLASRLVNACMARSGFHTPTVSAAAAASPLWDLSQFPDFAKMRRTGLMVPDPQNAPSAPPPRPPAGKRRAYNADLSKCQATASGPFRRLQSASEKLRNAWIVTFTGIQASARVQRTLSEFTSCVERAGVPAGYAQNFNRFAVWAGGQIQDPRNDAASLAANRHWGSVFVRCGQATETLFEKLQTSARAAFFREHDQQIKELETVVSQTVAVARHLLAKPGRPSTP